MERHAALPSDVHDQGVPIHDFLPAPQVRKSFFQSAVGFSLAQESLR
jgi:hypothetical protein